MRARLWHRLGKRADRSGSLGSAGYAFARRAILLPWLAPATTGPAPSLVFRNRYLLQNRRANSRNSVVDLAVRWSNGGVSRPEESLADTTEFVVPASSLLSEALRNRAVDEFGDESAWLILSQLVYSWRAYFDLGAGLAAAERPVEARDSRPTPPDAEFQIVKDLAVQGYLYSAAEQLAGVVVAAEAHATGRATFLDAYCADTRVAQLIRDANDLSRDDIGALVGEPLLPTTSFPSTTSSTTRPLLDPTGIEVVDVGGLYLPKRTIDDGAKAGLTEKARAIPDLVKGNLEQLRGLIDEPRAASASPRSRPLRDIDNSFRHGLRVLFHSANPNERTFRALSGDYAEIRSHAVDVYMPTRGRGESIRHGTVGCSPERTAQHLESLRQVCLRTGQFIRGFIGARCNGDAQLLLASVHLDLGSS